MKKPRIRPIALAAVRRGDDLLGYTGRDPATGRRIFRPLGGGIEFGETSAEAVHRELREELGAELTNVELLGVLESVFEWERRPHHEIAFVFAADLADRSFYERDELGKVLDADDEVSWQPISRFTEPSPPVALIPPGLLGLLGR
ncbi:NUDIX domain-containing protein [Frankia sp. CNm7]|uniref:NUDIX domain-containing protein n=1 Tax=Frankia nepalensis TaxID=1836974 RepID=A0A937UVY9_9ACTN|nr:NUDIX domain-containing protein [Frankia nepalensis]MBL7499985.1 NUDIX domain-containing protein [Frankia nepalensis]MBL7512518.1 NUDIX domain-containing protein [Frankia nepalensis]MBL7517429.1 NUDIX domain-containing protein [Frankia nepalensis]MBL7632821.1 NUDIX domain-containing protein [Frankia nepalensis]